MPSTAAGTEYLDISFTSSAGYASTMLIPKAVDGAPVPAVLFCHGSGTGDRSRSFTDATAFRALRNGLLDSGVMVIEGHVGGDHWGNARGTSAYEALVFDAAARNPIAGLLIYGRSMGGTVASWLATQPESKVKPYVCGLYLNSAVQNLYWWSFQKNGAGQPGGPAAAYGIKDQTSVTEFRTKTAGRDPLTFDPATFAGMPVLWIAGTADETVDVVFNSTAQRDRVYKRTPHHAFLVYAGEDHSSGSSGTFGHTPEELAFIDYCRGLTPAGLTYYSTPTRSHSVLDARYYDAGSARPMMIEALNPPRPVPVLWAEAAL